MAGRIDWPQNPTNAVPWTLDLATLNAIASPPSTAAAEAEFPLKAFDVRRCRGYSIQINPGTVTGSPVVDLQWSNDGINFQTLSATLTLASGVPTGWLVSDPWYPFARVVTSTAGTGTASLIPFMRS